MTAIVGVLSEPFEKLIEFMFIGPALTRVGRCSFSKNFGRSIRLRLLTSR